MSNCPECEPIAAAVYQQGLLITRLQAQTAPMRAALEVGLRGPIEALQHAIEARLRAEAEHAAHVQARAELGAQIAEMTGAGIGPVASMFASDVSMTPRDGWIEQRIGPRTLWFRNAQAIEQFGRAAGLQAMLDAYAAAEATEAASLTAVRAMNDAESAAQRRLDDAIERANQRLQEHADEIARATAEHRRLEAERAACEARCARGEKQDRRVGVVGAALMFAGMVLMVAGNMPGNGEAAAADKTTSSTPAAVASATGATATPVPAQIGPITARFVQQQFTTYYHVPVSAAAGTQVRVTWRGADCGTSQASGPLDFTWSHPHPPCDPSTSHADRTIIATVTIADAAYECRYPGAESGTGTQCTDSRGNRVAMATGGTDVTATPTRGAGTGATPATTITATAPSASATPSATASPTSGGSASGARTPTATATVGAPSSGGDNGGTTTAGLGLTIAGGVALGYAASRRRGTGASTGESGEEGADEGDAGTLPKEPPTHGTARAHRGRGWRGFRHTGGRLPHRRGDATPDIGRSARNHHRDAHRRSRRRRIGDAALDRQHHGSCAVRQRAASSVRRKDSARARRLANESTAEDG